VARFLGGGFDLAHGLCFDRIECVRGDPAGFEPAACYQEGIALQPGGNLIIRAVLPWVGS
jgi:hypothetical protein